MGVEGTGGVGGKVVLDQAHFLSLGELLSKVLHELGVFLAASFPIDLDPTSPSGRFKSQEDRATAVFLVLVVLPFRLTCFHRYGSENIANQETGSFIKTDQWVLWVVRQGIQV